MRILSWNVNGIRAAEKRGFAQWLRDESADVVCVQETKAHPGQLSEDLLRPWDNTGAPYFSYWAAAKQRGYSGTGIYSKTEPLEVRRLGIPAFDDEGRTLVADFGNLVLICAYFPNAQDKGARLGYKLDFCAAMLEFCNTQVTAGKRLVLCGDYNIAHTPLDLARPSENEETPGYLPEERSWMDAFIAAGYIDTFRHFQPGAGGHYSWWSYRTKARERNVGWRIDYHCVDRRFITQVRRSVIRPEVHGSDHCPVQLELAWP